MKQKLFSALIGILVCTNLFAQGVLRGKVTDENGESVIGATLMLKSNKTVACFTDLDGDFSLKIPDSNPQIIMITTIGFETQENPIQLKPNEVVVKNFTLQSSSSVLKEVEVTAKVVKAKDYFMEKVKLKL